MNETLSPSHLLGQSRGWLIFSGILSIVVGFLAMGSPVLFSAYIVVFLGILALISGVVSLAMAIFSKHVAHRVLDAVLAVIRIAAGIVLLRCLVSSLAVITLILAVFLLVEGVMFIAGAIKMRAHKGWGWMLVNGIAALILGIMLSRHWPSDSAWVLGLFYGINSLFWGMSLLMMGLGATKEAPGK